jgi:hypothetical protein
VKFEPTIKALEKAFNGDTDVLLFYVSWIKNGLNAGKAYKELHPEVVQHSADTLGSRMLKKVENEMVLQAYGLDLQKYFEQLKGGLNAMKRDQFSGEMSEDHKTRQAYHDKLGKLLGLEQGSGSTINIVDKQLNVNYNFTDADYEEASYKVLGKKFNLSKEEIIGRLG